MTLHRLLATVAFIALAIPAVAEEPVDMSTCAMCHEDEAAAFAAGPHGRAMAVVSNDVLEASCVACHGPGAEHVDDPMTTNINRGPKPATCLGCHPGREGLTAITAAAHVRHSVACLDCHATGHDDPGTDHLLADEPHELCATCHRSESGSFAMPYAHRDGTRPFECTNCHSIHGINRQGTLRAIGGGGVCLDCHTEKTGPFIYTHPPQQVNGCVTCHMPHGSTNPNLLTRPTVMMICLECHNNVPAFHDISRARYRVCTDCHTAVHGSNRDSRFFDE